MKNKNILALCVAVPLFIACTPAKQTGKDFQWGELPQQPDLSWADSVGSRQEPINHITLSAQFFRCGSRQYCTQYNSYTKSNRQLCRLRRGNRHSPTGILPDRGTLYQKRSKPPFGQGCDFTGQSSNSPLSGIPFKSCRNRNDMAIGSYQYHR